MRYVRNQDRNYMRFQELPLTWIYQNEVRAVKCIFISQFTYCPLVWVFHSHGKNNKINRIHEGCLDQAYFGWVATFF